MKPNFALNLSSDRVGLLHRTNSGWSELGVVAFDDANPEVALARLRERAHSMSDDHSCKLVIPRDQIKYLTLEAEGDPDEVVRAALNGATPYAVDDLEYDWIAEGRLIHVAAVALETLSEAESFAVEHGFEPVSFAAIPEAEEFRGEPFFGVTKWAARTLPNGTNVQRDETPVRIVSEPKPSKDDATVPPNVVSVGSPDADSVAPSATRAVAEAGPAPKRDPAVKETLTPAGNPAAPIPAPIAQTPPDTDKATDKSSGKASPQTPAAPPTKSAGTPPSIRASRSDEANVPSRAPKVAPEPPRRSTQAGSDKAPAATAAPSLPSPASEGASDPAMLDELAAGIQPDPKARLDRSAIDAAKDEAGPQRAVSDTRASGSKGPPPRAKAKKAAPAAKHADEKGRMTVFGARQGEVRGKPRFLGLILTAILLLFLIGVAAWASMFLDDGLARFFGRGDDIKLADVPVSNEDAEHISDPVATDDDLSERREIRPLPEEVSERIASLPKSDTPAREVVSLPDRPSPLSPNEALTRYAATGIWQMAPTPPEIPSAGAPLADLYQVSLDPGIAFGEPANLPRRTPDARDTMPDPPSAPPPPGMRFDFDARGLVRAKPAGVLTPEGIRVFAGRPALTPPADMAQTVSVTATASPELIEEAGLDAEEGETVTFAGDPTLANVRPRLRPTNAQIDSTADQLPDDADESRQSDENTPAATDNDEVRTASAASTAAFVGDPSLSVLRPRPRSTTVSAIGATLQSTSGRATAPLLEDTAHNRAAADEPDALGDAAFDNATPQAVTASLAPLRRPGDFETIVKRTRERAARAAQKPAPSSQQQQQQQQQQPVRKSPQAQPSIPSSTSVAKQATQPKVLNLREVNLIGVYGSTANRRALVRLGNGRYQKVTVGDALDGGQVAAIGDSELHYIKRGRKVVLRMPQG